MITEDKTLTTQYHKWLKHGANVDPLVKKTVHQKLLNTDNSDGSNRVRPSLLGDCKRKQVLSMHGVTPDQRPSLTAQKAFAYGNAVHRHWQEAGMTIGFLTDIEVPVSYEELKIAGSVDGLCKDGSVFELKTISPRQWDQEAMGPVFVTCVLGSPVIMPTSVGISIRGGLFAERQRVARKIEDLCAHGGAHSL